MLPDACSCAKVFCWKLTVTSGWLALSSSSALAHTRPCDDAGSSYHQMLNVFCWANAPLLSIMTDAAAVASSVSFDSEVMFSLLLISGPFGLPLSNRRHGPHDRAGL